MNFAKFLKASFDRTPPDDCFLCVTEFWGIVQITSFIEYLWETSYFKYKLLDFNHQIQEKSISQVLFKHFIQEQEVASYSKARTSHQRCSIKKGVLRETPVPQSLYNKVAGLRPAILLKKTPALVFPCEFYEVSKNNFFTEHLRATASGGRSFT